MGERWVCKHSNFQTQPSHERASPCSTYPSWSRADRPRGAGARAHRESGRSTGWALGAQRAQVAGPLSRRRYRRTARSLLPAAFPPAANPGRTSRRRPGFAPVAPSWLPDRTAKRTLPHHGFATAPPPWSRPLERLRARSASDPLPTPAPRRAAPLRHQEARSHRAPQSSRHP